MDTCGAKTRAGTPCKQKAIYWNGRCKFHGGLATGPTTEAGKEQSRINGRKGGRPRKDAAEKTQAIEPQGIPKILASALISDAQVSARVSALQAAASSAAEPKSWMLKEVKVLPQCERCTMFASNGACLAVAKGMIPSMPTGENCPAFSAF